MMVFCHVTMCGHSGERRILYRNITRRELVDYFVNPYIARRPIVSEGCIWSADKIAAPEIFETPGKISGLADLEDVIPVTGKFIPASLYLPYGFLQGFLNWLSGAGQSRVA